MSLSLDLHQEVICEEVIVIAEKAADAILSVYNSKVYIHITCSLAAQGTSPDLLFPHTAPIQDEDWNVERKSDNSPLTRADREANAIICEGLAALGTVQKKTSIIGTSCSTIQAHPTPHHAAPHIPIVSEENKAIPFSIRKVFFHPCISS